MRRINVALLGAVYVLGVVVGATAAGGKNSEPSLYLGKKAKDAARALLEVAKVQAGAGSWQNIAIARVYTKLGDEAQAKAILDAVQGGKMKKHDWLRIGRLYSEAGEWQSAKEAFEKALLMDVKDADLHAEIGAHFNLHGDRTRAEELFTRSFELDPSEFWNTVNAAGSYVDLAPQ